MTFLNPAVLFGLVAAAIPVLLHLLNLRKLKKIEFSTLSFLKELRKNKIRKIKLKQWLLLALRVLIIIFLVTAFARPALKGISIGGTASAAKTTAIFIIDDTFSMSVISENGSHFNQARQMIRNLLDGLQEGDDAAILRVSEAADQEIKTTSNLQELRKEIDGLNISYKSGTLHAAISKAAQMLYGSRNFNKEIYLFSDFQKDRLSNKGEAFSNFSHLLNDKVKLYSFRLPGDDSFNAAIDSLTVNNQILEPGKPISFTCRVRNYSNRTLNNFVVSLFVNGSRSAQRSVTLSPGESRQIVFETTLKSAGFIEVFAETEDDDVLQDNRKYLSFSIPEKTNTAIFASSPEDARFIEAAVTSGGSGFNITSRSINQINSFNLNDFDAIILIGSSGITQNADRIREYLRSGGGILLMPDADAVFTEFRNACAALGLPAPGGSAGTQNSNAQSAAFFNIDYEHPLFSGLFAPGAKRQIESPDIYYYFKLFPQGRGKNIISLVDNSSFLSEYKITNGRALVISSAPSLEWGTLPLKAIFAPLIYRSASYLAFRAGAANSYIAGQSANINLKNNVLPQLRVVKPDSSAEFINLQSASQNYFPYGNTEQTGNYKIFSGGTLLDYFSVNTDPAESDLSSMDENNFKEYLDKIGFKGTDFQFEPGDDYLKEIRQARFGSELWRIFLLAALILAIIEMTVSRVSKKEMESTND